MDLRRTIHNFVNPNQELRGRTPAEMAEITLKLRRNKLLNLIKFVRDNTISYYLDNIALIGILKSL